MYITKIVVKYFSGATKEVRQIVLPLLDNIIDSIEDVILVEDNGNEYVYKYNNANCLEADKSDYAETWESKNEFLFGQARIGGFYYFVAYSPMEMDILDSFESDYYEKGISVEAQDGYLKWTSFENRFANRKKLVARSIYNGVIVPLQDEQPDEKIYSFNYLNIVDVIKQAVLMKKSAYVRVGRYDDYIDNSFSFASAIQLKRGKDYVKIILITYDTGTNEGYNVFKIKSEEFDKLKIKFMKSHLAGLSYLIK